MGFGDLLLRWISLLLYTANTRVLVNGVPGDRIQHARGLRQGDPTSPLLFVAGMEVLTRLFTVAAQEPLLGNVAGISPLQRVSIYADDVVVFLRPETQDLLATREVLSLFSATSGLHVNYRKTTATLIRESVGDRDRVTEVLGCDIANFPIKYLGLQLALRPLTKAEWQPMLDGVIHSIPAWQRGLVTRAGRLVLIKSVISARPIHHILVEDAPAWLLEEVDKWLRAFFWAGKKEVHGGQCLVAWENICRPLCQGGLGVKDLCLQGLALRVRWEWLKCTDPHKPWQGLKLAKDAKALEVFQSCTKIELGDGRSVLFWLDRWIMGRTAHDIAPDVVELVTTRRKNATTVADALIGDAWGNIEPDPEEVDLVFDLSPSFAEVVAQVRVELNWNEPNDGVELEGRHNVGFGMHARWKTMRINSEQRWSVYKETVAGSQDKALELFATKTVDARIELDLNRPSSPVRERSPPPMSQEEATQSPIVQSPIAQQPPLDNEYDEHDDGDDCFEMNGNNLGDLDKYWTQEEMDHSIPYSRCYASDSDDDGPEEEVDEDGFTAKEAERAEIFKKVTGRDIRVTLFRDVSLADGAVVDGGKSLLLGARPISKRDVEARTSMISKGLTFDTFLELKIWLKEFSIKHHRPYIVVH
ncbi:hypothetical protein QYE76_028048 [Lolium multiflorum]|uniref:Reverse transcriptase domain-containing protein n=1 Tax=Lolium multiflorum TaxID=4521 RepID=A0AAD8QL59_LOLMU|nr:hypothetical protein QYE76_028048 [Lolium multiflorum]